MAIGTAVTFGQSSQTGTTGGGGGTSVLTTTVAVPVGALAIVFLERSDSGADLSTVVDSVGNTWSIAKEQGSVDPDPAFAAIAWSVITTQIPSSGTVTGTYASAFSSTRQIAGQYHTGTWDAASCLDVVNGATVGSGAKSSSWNSGATGTLATAVELVVACCGTNGATVAPTNTPGGSFLEVHDFASGVRSLHTEYLITSAATTQTATGTLTQTAFWSGAIAAFKETTGGGTTQVSTTRRVVYDVQAQVAATRRVNYGVQVGVAATRRVAYNVVAAVLATRSIRYDVQAQVAATRRVVYDVAASTSQVTAPRRIGYSVSAQVSTARRVVYDVMRAVAATRAINYDVVASALATRRVAYSVAGNVNAARRIIYTVDGLAGPPVVAHVRVHIGTRAPQVQTITVRL